MSEQPTPETDVALYPMNGVDIVWPEFARKLERERDEARINAEKSKAYKRVLKETNLRQTERIRYLEGATNHACGTPLSVALKERDEARNAIVGWENKWKCAIDMAARAELERDEALKDAKNYHAKMVNLINEREDARELAQQMSESNQVLQAEVRDYRKKEKLKP